MTGLGLLLIVMVSRCFAYIKQRKTANNSERIRCYFARRMTGSPGFLPGTKVRSLIIFRHNSKNSQECKRHTSPPTIELSALCATESDPKLQFSARAASFCSGEPACTHWSTRLTRTCPWVYCSIDGGGLREREMFEDFGKSNLVNWLAFGVVAAVLPKLLPDMRPGMVTAVQVVIGLLTEAEAEAAEELMEALVSSTIAEINRHMSQTDDPEEARQSVERSITRFRHKARQRAHRWGSDHDDRHRRYERHLRKLRKEVERSKDQHDGWQRNIFDDVGEIIEEAP